MAGRPPKYTEAQQLKKKADAYFALCKKDKQPPEKAGLCLALGITRETYNQYRAKPEFSDAIRSFDFRVESWWARRLAGQSATGAIFYLKNAFKDEYKDRTETDITSGGEKLNIAGPLSKVYGPDEGTGDTG